MRWEKWETICTKYVHNLFYIAIWIAEKAEQLLKLENSIETDEEIDVEPFHS